MLNNVRRIVLAMALCAPFIAFAQDPAPPAPASDAASATAPDAPAAPATEAAPAPSAEAAAAAPAADTASMGTVVFFREKKFAGAAIQFKVREGGKELGKLSSGVYFTAQLPAGKHEFEVHSEAKDVLAIEVEPGETYYLIGTVTMGLLVGHPNLSPSDQGTFEKVKASLKDVTGQDIGGGTPDK